MAGLVVNIGVLVSGRGSNLESILEKVREGHIRSCAVRVVISNRPGVRALEVAKAHGVATETIESTGFKGNRKGYDALLAEALKRHGVTPEDGLVLLAGFDRIVSPEFAQLFASRMLNIHPALLPAFTGLHAQKQALDYGAKVAGCSVHFVIPEVDAGPIIIQSAVPILEDDTEETLSDRILVEEHRIYPEAVRLFVEGKLRLDGRRVRVLQ